MIDLLVYCRLLTGTVQKLADWYFHNGSPVLAACCHMSVDDCQVQSYHGTLGVARSMQK